MKKFALPLFALFILSAFALVFSQATVLSPRQLELANQPALPAGTQIDKLIVYKSKREMHAFYQDKLIKIYPVSLGKSPIGHKQFEGDMKTPEGIYTINDRNANSSYHKNLGISYPNAQDVAFAKSHGKSAGTAIKIHGIKNGLGDVIGANHLLKDWTHGCIAVTDQQIDELFVAVVDNAPIHILP
ncbi:MAG: L,D-transpeptidase family protein [Moraxella sp.]|nr:L,D-transpeptidase family protein [Moraxella sp.]